MCGCGKTAEQRLAERQQYRDALEARRAARIAAREERRAKARGETKVAVGAGTGS